ncbi:MAG: hypothetical protein ACLUAR_16840 [Pilosibacter sp.]
MDDGNPWIGIVLFAASVILFGGDVLDSVRPFRLLNTSALEDERDEAKQAGRKNFAKIQEDPYLFIRHRTSSRRRYPDACDGRVLAGVCG